MRRGIGLALAAVLTLNVGSADAAFGDRALRKGSTGRGVRVLQSWLTRLGYPTAVDGVFGRATRRSVRRYERAEHLRVDGRVSRREARGIRRRVEATRPAPTGRGEEGPRWRRERRSAAGASGGTRAGLETI